MTGRFLHELPISHPDRNRPLAGCFYRWRHAKSWRVIKPEFAIAKCTFNQLGSSWTDYDVFTFDKKDAIN